MKINEFKHTGSLSTEITEREQRNRILAREIAEEGIVLLKNDGLLPLQPEKPLSLLGGGAVMTIKGGTGSGDVNERHSVSILEGFRNQKVPHGMPGSGQSSKRRMASRDSFSLIRIRSIPL